MPAYSFKAQFAEPILAGTKGGTIRVERRQPRRGQFQRAPDRPGGHARAGETLALYTGMRTRQCRLIARRPCLATERAVLNFTTDQVLIGDLVLWTPEQLHAFAVFDGFGSWADLVAFWRVTHGAELRHFDGWHIRWLPWPTPLPTPEPRR